MPIFSGDALGIGVGMDGKDFGMSLRTWRVWVNVQLAETAPERLVAFHVKRLIAKEQDLMLRQRLVQLLDLAVAERLGERQAVDLGANARRDRRDVDGFVGHGVTSRVRGIYMSFRGQPPPPQPSQRFLGCGNQLSLDDASEECAMFQDATEKG